MNEPRPVMFTSVARNGERCLRLRDEPPWFPGFIDPEACKARSALADIIARHAAVAWEADCGKQMLCSAALTLVPLEQLVAMHVQTALAHTCRAFLGHSLEGTRSR